MVKLNLEIKSLDKNGVFDGYASVFNVVDLHGDIVKQGSFAHCLKHSHVDNIKMLFDHDPSLQIGKWLSIMEDDCGLLVQGIVNMRNPFSQKIYLLMKNKMVSGLSIGFIPIITMKDKCVRKIFQVDLKEISIVRNPANQRACLF
ncbi:MAG: HK97 family phage prohead protease [Alphaproteobacteria bacterium]|nr:MAG: HK97 family phage prohead protease [Alphaproteobacteria bacterium]